jgi:hypothetical protein
LVPVVVVVAARVLLALASDGVALGISLAFFISPGGDHVLDMGDGARDDDMNTDTRTSTPAASSSTPPEDTLLAPFFGPLTRARARDLNFVLLLTNEGREDGKIKGDTWGQTRTVRCSA